MLKRIITVLLLAIISLTSLLLTSCASNKIKTIEDLSGKTISAVTGSIFDLLVKEIVPDTKFVYHNTLEDQISALIKGSVDGVALDEPMAKFAVAQNSDLEMLSEEVVDDIYGIAMQKDSLLVSGVNKALKELEEEGVFDELTEKWFGTDESVKKLPTLDYEGKNGTLKIAHELDLAPMAYVDESGNSLGYEVEMIMYIAQKLDYNVEFEPMPFASLIPSLENELVDIAVATISISDAREKVIDFSDSHYNGGVYIVVKK